MHRSICFVLLGLGALLSCGQRPGSYPPPSQRSLDTGLGAFIKMEDPLAADYIVRDISSERGLFRWAYLHPELRFRLSRSENLRFVAEIAIPEETFKTTGPVEVSCAINGNELTSIRCPKAGKYQIGKAVPSAWLDTQKPVRVTFHAEPRWVAPSDGAQLSFLLFSAGFID